MKFDLYAKPMKRVSVGAQTLRLKLLALVGVLAASLPSAHAAWIEETSDAVTFTPSELINPVITAAVAALVAALGIFVLYRGSKWIMKVFSATK